MENLHGSDRQDEDAEEIPNDFQCCVCLDLFHKPVVLACGHIACFWCVFKAMKSAQTSHCMVCRHPFNHFPRVCKLLHYLIMKLYPLAYKRRERQVSEMEEKQGSVSPQFETQSAVVLSLNSTDGSPRPVENVVEPLTCENGEVPLTMVSPIESPCTLMRGTTSNSNTRERIATENGGQKGAWEPIPVKDFSCTLCKQLLCQPVVLNCGDVFCEECIKDPCGGVNRCPVCDSPHPSSFPNVCLILDHFLEERFHFHDVEYYEARKRSLNKQVDDSHQQMKQSTGSDNQMEPAATSSNYFASWLSGLGQKVHLGIGCDYCGMYPITGKRYKCKECVEKIGFDLCGQCYQTCGKLPVPAGGRFNQHHNEKHQFTTVEAPTFNDILHRPEAGITTTTFNDAAAIVLAADEALVHEEEEEEEEEELHLHLHDPQIHPSSSV